MKKKKVRRLLRWLLIVPLTPIALFLLLAVLIYIPPVQHFAVGKVTAALSESLHMQVSIGSVRLAFPLDLALHRVNVTERGDTLLDARSLRLNVRLLPLLSGRADVDGLELYGVVVDTRSYLSDTRIKGHAKALTAAAHGVDWKQEVVKIDRAALRGADFLIALSDTAQDDTTKTALRWNISVARADISHSRLRLSLPGDTLHIGATIGRLSLRDGRFDLGSPYYSVRSLSLSDCGASYDLTTAKPTAGLDPNHLSLTDLNLQLDTLSYNADGELRAALRHARVSEKSGLAVAGLHGSVYMDTSRLILPALHMATPHSRLDASVSMDYKSLLAGGDGKLSALVDASIGRADIVSALSGRELDATLQQLPAAPLTVKAEASGNADHLRLDRLHIAWPGICALEASGYVVDALKDQRRGDIKAKLTTRHMAPVEALLPASLRRTLRLPGGMRAEGNVKFRADDYDVRLRLDVGGGSLALKARTNLRRETYTAQVGAVGFPVRLFAPSLAIGPVTGQVKAAGHSFDPVAPRAAINAEAALQRFSYDRHDLSGIKAHAGLRQGRLEATATTAQGPLQGTLHLDASLTRKLYKAALTADLHTIDLLALGVSKDSVTAGTKVEVEAATDAAFSHMSLAGSLRQNRFSSPRKSAMAKDITFDLATSPDTTTALVSAGDLYLRAGSKAQMEGLMRQADRLMGVVKRQLADRHIDQAALKPYLPSLSFHLDAGQDNPIYNIARFKGYSFSGVHLVVQTHPDVGLSGRGNVGRLKLGKLQLDTIHTRIFQDSTGIQIEGYVRNERKTNPNPFEARLKTYFLNKGAGIELAFFDAQGKKGVDMGLRADFAPEGMTLRLYPDHPVLAYRSFRVNRDNFIFLGRNKSIRADVDLVADDGTTMKIYGEPKAADADTDDEAADSLALMHASGGGLTQTVADTSLINDLTVSLSHLNLGELSNVLPYLPRFSGMLSGDFHLTDDRARKQFSAMASLQADDFSFEGTDLGRIGLEAIYLPKGGGEHHASAFVSSGDEEVLDIEGTYFDRDGGTYEGTARLHDFPLQMLNGFMTGTDVALKGIAEGELEVKGAAGSPTLNGTLDLNEAHIYSDVYGFDFRTDERAVEIRDGRLIFDNYNLYSTGRNPLVLNGVFDMSDFSRMQMDITAKASNFELINTKKKAQSMVYGKVYSHINASVKGTTDNLSIRGRLEVLNRTNMTYILKDSPLSVDDRLHNLVQFVSFTDTLARPEEPLEPAASFNLVMGISVSDAAIFHCNLSEDGQSYVDLEGGGDLTMRMTDSGDMSLTGRFTVNSGEMKYALPVIPLKAFKLEQGSYVEFTGDMMNPTLHITAKERTKAVVTEDDQQRSVAFDVGVKLTKPLNDMGLEFTIEAPEDLSIQNELAAMSAEQRGKAAVTLMATGMYMSEESMMQGSGFKANNALNAFLQSEIQQIAGSALKTVDISLGVESGTSEVGTTTTDYSFQFAKRFWGNRVSVIVGGKVSTGADAQNSTESFINNVSVEYRLDRGATRYVKVFYDRDTQDPLEGALTRTGAGLVLRRKTDRLGELFIFKKKKTVNATHDQ